MSVDTDVILKVLALFGGSGGLGYALLKRWQPRKVALSGELDEVRADRAEDKAQHEKDMRELRSRLTMCEKRIQYTSDYAEVLRAHISDGKPPPPPPWPHWPEEVSYVG